VSYYEKHISVLSAKSEAKRAIIILQKFCSLLSKENQGFGVNRYSDVIVNFVPQHSSQVINPDVSLTLQKVHTSFINCPIFFFQFLSGLWQMDSAHLLFTDTKGLTSTKIDRFIQFKVRLNFIVTQRDKLSRHPYYILTG